MIPAKEAKDMLYTLLSENLVQLQVTHNAERDLPFGKGEFIY